METQKIADDLLTGAREIAEFVGMKERRAYYLLERGELPSFKVGKVHHALKSKLRQHFERLAGGEAA